jgi:hypothetical protein
MRTDSIKVYALGKCYACGLEATGLRDRRPEGGEVEPACLRHAEPRLVPILVCIYCGDPTRKGSLVVDGEQAHAKCHREACAS